VTKLAPKSLVGQLMGTWFMGTALGNLIAGLAAGGFAGMGITELFTSVAKVTGVAGIVLLIFSPLLRRLIGGGEGATPEGEITPGAAPAAREGALPT
jgi:POT family proton-dependent oligopeptide transporter